MGYKRKYERKKESIESLTQKVESNKHKPKKYSYEDVPRYHLSNQVVAVRYPSDESSKFPHFPAVKDQLDFELGKSGNEKSHKKINIRPVRQKPANTYREDSQSQP